MLKRATEDLEELGGKRDTASEQCQYLLKISMAFQEIVTSALSANYAGSDWFDEYPNLRFATDVVNRNEIVATTGAKHGHSYEFSSPSTSEVQPEATENEEDKGEPGKPISLRFHDDFDGLDEL